MAKRALSTLSKVVVTARPFDSTVKLLRAAAQEVVVNDQSDPFTPTELQTHLADADACLAFMTDKVDASLLSSAPKLKLIACALKGFDNFDIEACSSRGVAVTAVPDLLTAPTAELAIALTLGLGRKVMRGDQLIRRGNFEGWRPKLYGLGLAGSTVGFLGFGAVGQATAARLTGFEVAQMLYVDPRDDLTLSSNAVRVSGVDELLRMSDIVVCCAPLNPSTHHILNASRLTRAKRGLLLVNISRGSCVDEEAVAHALDNGILGGYAADVFEFEDWSIDGRPLAVNARLLANANTILTPHLGSAVSDVREQIEHAAASEIVRFANGEPLSYRVN